MRSTAKTPDNRPASPSGHRRIITWSLLVVVAWLPIALLGLYALRITTRSVHELVEANNDSAAKLTGELLARQTEQSIGFARVAASFPGLITGIEKHDEEAVRRRLQGMVEKYPRLDRALVTDTNGVVWSDYPRAEELIGKNLSDQDWYRGLHVAWQPYVSEVYESPAAPKALVVAVAVPVHDTRQQLIGLLVTQYRADSLSQWLKQLKLGSSGNVFVIDHTGTVAAHPKLDIHTRFYEQYATIPPIQQALRGESQNLQYVDPISQRTMVAAFAPVTVGNHRWVVVAAQPADEAYAPVRQAVIHIAIAAAILALGAIGVVVGRLRG